MATITSYIDQFLSDIRHTKWQEWLSTLSQIISVWYAKKNDILVYPTGILGVLLAAWVYYFVANPPLYADATLNVYYFLMSVYGWYSWTRKKESTTIYPISWCDHRSLISGLALFFHFVVGHLSFVALCNRQQHTDTGFVGFFECCDSDVVDGSSQS